jgi:hypothetical protein
MRQSAWRRILTLAITLLLLSTGLPSGARPTAAAPLRGGGAQYLSIAGTSFVSTDSANSYAYQAGGGVKLTGVSGTSPWPFMTTPIELPDGAVPVSLTLFYTDSDSAASIQLYLVRYDWAGGFATVASVSSLDGGPTSRNASTVASDPVDNSTYTYALLAEIDSANLILYGARVGYSPPTWAAAASAGERPLAPSGDQLPAADLAMGPGTETARYTGGQVIFLAPPSAGLADGDKSANVETFHTSTGPTSLAVGNPAHWKRYTVPASTFHPIYSGTAHFWSGGGGRYVTTAPATGTPLLVAPLDLIDGKTIRQVKFTYYDASTTNPYLYLYRVNRLGSLSYLWMNSPAASGGYFAAISPPMNEVVDNENYAYYFLVSLGDPPVSYDLRAMEVEVDYVLDTYLPIILRNP